MMNQDKLDAMIETISNYANKKIKADREDFALYEWASQIDDAYELGEDTGRVRFARELMKIINSSDAQ